MTLTIDDALGEQLKTLAAEYGRDTNSYLAELLDQTFNHGGTLPGGYVRPLTTPDWVSRIAPSCPADDGTNGLHRIVGKWPGDETDEEILTLLEANS